MSTESPHILVVDDDADITKAARLLLERHAMTVTTATNPAAAWIRLAEASPDVILLDLNFARGRTSGEEGFAMLDRLIAADRDAVVIVVTGHSGIAVAVQAMRSGATDFVIKPWHNERLLATVQSGVALRRAKLDAASAPTVVDGVLLGESAGIARVRDRVARVAPSAAPVLITGPTGTGKTLVGQLIHEGSANAYGALVTLDGEAADGATVAAQVSAATGGSLMIDHLDRLPRALQGELARRMDDVRVIATTRLDHAGLRAAVGEELLYRVNTIEIDLPPLAERDGDALLLAQHFLAVFAHRYGKPHRVMTDETAQAIAQGQWADNVRGLRLAMERMVLLGEGATLDLTAGVLPLRAGNVSLSPQLSLADNERAMIDAALKRHAFNVSRAATELGLTRAALYRRMARHGL